MDLLALIGIGIVGTVVPLLSPEATAAGYGHVSGHSPWLIAMLLATGQAVTYTGLYFGGARVLPRWRTLRDAVDRTRTRFSNHLERRAFVISLLAGTVGLPPAMALAALAPGFHIRLAPLLTVLFVCRVGRFFLLASAGANAMGVWDWLRTLVA